VNDRMGMASRAIRSPLQERHLPDSVPPTVLLLDRDGQHTDGFTSRNIKLISRKRIPRRRYDLTGGSKIPDEMDSP